MEASELTKGPKRPPGRPKGSKGGPGRRPGSRNKMFGLMVREAKDDLVLPLLQVDIDEAQKHKPDSVDDQANFLCCVIAQTATRVCGAERVAILRRHAYVAFPGDKKTNRYVIDEHSRDVLERWDRGEPILEGVALKLRAPAKSQTRAAHHRRKVDKAAAGGYQKTARKQRKSDPLEGVIRNGNMVKWS